MSTLHAIGLGIVQGLSEFLPISSSGHLSLARWLFGWDDFAGRPELAKTFDVALHMGTLVGAFAYFWRDILRYLRAAIGDVARVVGRGDAGEPMSVDARVGWLLLLSALPAAAVGAVLDKAVESLEDWHWLIGVNLIVFGLLLWWSDRLAGERQESDFAVRDAAAMGVGQALALVPGVSRSGVTMTVGRRLGFSRDGAARVSFLMSLPIIAGAGVFKAARVASSGGIPEDFRSAFAWGLVASGISGYLAVWGLLRFVRTRTFTPFVIYRVGLGVVVLALAATGFRAS